MAVSLLFLLSYFVCCIISKIQKISLLYIVVICVTCFIFVKWLLLKIPSCVTLLAPTIMILFAHSLLHLLLKRTFCEIKPALLNLVMKEQFSGISTEDAASHLNNFVEICEMQKYRDIDGDIVKLKLFPFSLRGRAKDWLLSLPRNSIDSWVKCKDDFIRKYYPPAKIISLRSDIMKFRQSDGEHVAQAWERMKSLVKNCPTHGLTTWMIIQTFLCRTEFFFNEFIGFICWRYLYHNYFGGSNKAP